MNKDYLVTIISDKDLTKPYSQFRLPFLPRVGDNIIIDESESYQVLQCNIEINQIMISKPDQSKKIVQINNPNPTSDDTIIIPVVMVCNVINTKSKSDNKDSINK